MTPRQSSPPSWGTLLTAARKSAGLSGRRAARLAGVSEAHWRQITSGYQTVNRIRVPVRGTAATIARMAAAVGVTPGQLDDAGRPDAARVLTTMREAPTAEAVLAELDQRIATMPPEEGKKLLREIGLRLAGEERPEPGPAPPAVADVRDISEARRYGT